MREKCSEYSRTLAWCDECAARSEDKQERRV